MHFFRAKLSKPQEFDISKILAAGNQAGEKLKVVQSERDLTLCHANIWGVTSTSRDNPEATTIPKWVPFLRFELDEAGKLAAVSRAHSVVTGDGILSAARGLDQQSPEFVILRDYAVRVHNLTKKFLDYTNKNSHIDYTLPRSRENPVIGGVFQGYYARAQGPQGKIGYLGTFGLGPCVGVAAVTKVEGEAYPRVSVAHVSAMTSFDDSVEELLKKNAFGEGTSRVYLATGNRQNSHVLKVVEALEQFGIAPSVDLGMDGTKALIVNLTSGQPVDSSNMNGATWLVSNKLMREELRRIRSGNVRKSPLQLEYDLRDGIPQDHELQVRSPARPNPKGHEAAGAEAIPLG